MQSYQNTLFQLEEDENLKTVLFFRCSQILKPLNKQDELRSASKDEGQRLAY